MNSRDAHERSFGRVGRIQSLRPCVALSLLIITCVGLSHAGLVNAPQDGFYWRSTDTSLPTVAAQDGSGLHLGGKCGVKVKEAYVFSQDNANSNFYVSVRAPYDAKLDTPSATVLVVNGTGYRQSGSGSSHKETSYLDFHVEGRNKAEEIAAYLGVKTRYRHHPRHCLLTRFVPAKPNFEPGEDVWVTLRIVNVGSNTVSFMKGGRNRAPRDNQYAFTAYHRGRQVRDVGSNGHFGGISVAKTLKPGEVFEDKVSLSKWFAFDRRGMYQVTGTYYLAFLESGDHPWQTIWENHVAGEFTVRVKGEPTAREGAGGLLVPVGVTGSVKPEIVKSDQPIPLTVTVSNGLPSSVYHNTFAIEPNEWNGESCNVSLVDIRRDGKAGNLYLARPEMEVPITVAGMGRREIKRRETLSIRTDARKWKLRDGWLPGRYSVTIRVDGIAVDARTNNFSVLSEPVRFRIVE